MSLFYIWCLFQHAFLLDISSIVAFVVGVIVAVVVMVTVCKAPPNQGENKPVNLFLKKKQILNSGFALSHFILFMYKILTQLKKPEVFHLQLIHALSYLNSNLTETCDIVTLPQCRCSH